MELENFKAFGETNRIEFAPITLTFGEKSAIKSSILQALNLLIQTRQSRDHGALLLPRTEGGFVELG
jgi:predicted ATP-dependent endonuclease of OLD family